MNLFDSYILGSDVLGCDVLGDDAALAWYVNPIIGASPADTTAAAERAIAIGKRMPKKLAKAGAKLVALGTAMLGKAKAASPAAAAAAATAAGPMAPQVLPTGATTVVVAPVVNTRAAATRVPSNAAEAASLALKTLAASAARTSAPASRLATSAPAASRLTNAAAPAAARSTTANTAASAASKSVASTAAAKSAATNARHATMVHGGGGAIWVETGTTTPPPGPPCPGGGVWVSPGPNLARVCRHPMVGPPPPPPKHIADPSVLMDNTGNLVLAAMTSLLESSVTIPGLVASLDSMGTQTTLANAGNDIVTRINNIDYDPGSEDPDAPAGTGAGMYDMQTVNDANAVAPDVAPWIAQATAAGAVAGSTAPGISSVPVAPGTAAPWYPSNPYALGAQASNGGSIYRVITAGTSAPIGGPYGYTQSIPDGTVLWAYVGPDMNATLNGPPGGGGDYGGGGGGSDADFGDDSDSGGGDGGDGEFDDVPASDLDPTDPNAQMDAALDGGDGGGDDGSSEAPYYDGAPDSYADAPMDPNAEMDADVAASGGDSNADTLVGRGVKSPHKRDHVVGDDSDVDEDAPGFSIASALPKVSDDAWTKFVVAVRGDTKVGAVSPSNALGMFELKPRRLADLGLVKNISNTRADNGRMIWVGEFVAPMTSKKFLKDPAAQYKAFCCSMTDYVSKLKKGTIPKPEGGPSEGMTLSGVLAILHRCGPSGLKTWNDESKRFPETVALYERANGIF